jgi:hypothetical protein
MRKRFIGALGMFVVCACIVTSTGSPVMASEQLLNGALEISGFAKETIFYKTSFGPGEKSDHNTRVDLALTSLYFESIYTIKDDTDGRLTWFNGLRYWYEASTSFDDNAHQYVPHNDRGRYQHPTKGEDIITETYMSFVKGPWDIRVGKQIIIWGQLDTSRVADVVNPLDLRRGVPGVDNWEEIKQGLWMINTSYQSTLPGNLIFQNIINPGYYRNLLLPYEGTHWGPDHASNSFGPNIKSPTIYHWQQEKWNADAPTGWNLDNWELGFRVQGYTYDVDWSLLYWNARSDGPTARVHNATAYGNNFALPNVVALITGAEYAHPKYWDGGKCFSFKRFQTFGGTAQTVIQPLHNSVWRLEWFYEYKSPFNTGVDGSNQSLTGVTRQNLFGAAVSYSDKYQIPWFTQAIGTGKYFELTLTYFIEHVFNMNSDICIADRNHRQGDPNAQSLSLFMMQQMFNASWTFTFNSSYYPMIKKWYYVPCFTYTWPGEHWRTDLGAAIYGGSNNEYVGQGSAHKDVLLFRMRYEF